MNVSLQALLGGIGKLYGSRKATVAAVSVYLGLYGFELGWSELRMLVIQAPLWIYMAAEGVADVVARARMPREALVEQPVSEAPKTP